MATLSSLLGTAYSTQGLQGNQGTQGLQGPAGTVQGAQGLQGLQGLSNQGVQGLQGLQGPGNQGLQGLAGSAQGTQGTFGPATIPQNPEAAAYTLTAADNGYHVSIGFGVTVPSGVFNSGENVVIYNNSAATIGITTATGGVILRLAGTSQTGNRFLSQRGLATILCVGSNDFVISGAGVT